MTHWMDLGIWKRNIEGIIKLCCCWFEIELLCVSFLISNWDITSPYQKYSLGIEVLSLCLFCTDRRAESRVSLAVILSSHGQKSNILSC